MDKQIYTLNLIFKIVTSWLLHAWLVRIFWTLTFFLWRHRIIKFTENGLLFQDRTVLWKLVLVFIGSEKIEQAPSRYDYSAVETEPVVSSVTSAMHRLSTSSRTFFLGISEKKMF